jgi:16S rRNA (guanine966-N2)-methyltransferase
LTGSFGACEKALVRIVAGSLGGRALTAPRGQATRPTTDKVRQALFNIITGGGALAPIAVLDLYAGSGALGLEALSRGAARAVFVEKATPALRALDANLAALDVTDRTQVVRAEVLRALPRLAGPFGLVLVDPPYDLTAKGETDRVLHALPPLLGADALVVVEHDRRSPPKPDLGPHSPLALRDRRRYGDTEVSFYR